MSRWSRLSAPLTAILLAITVVILLVTSMRTQARIDRFCAGTATTLDLSAPDALALCRP